MVGLLVLTDRPERRFKGKYRSGTERTLWLCQRPIADGGRFSSFAESLVEKLGCSCAHFRERLDVCGERAIKAAWVWWDDRTRDPTEHRSNSKRASCVRLHLWISSQSIRPAGHL